MFTGFAVFAVIFQLAIFCGIIVFAVKLLNRMQEISDSQRISAEAQAQLVKLVMQQHQATVTKASSEHQNSTGN